MRYWLLKSEPATFSLADLARRPGQTEPWDGVRNYQARNMLRDQMKLGDQVFFYHSNCEEPAIVGIVEVVREGHPDTTAFDPEHKHFDPRSDPANPRWIMVEVKFVRALNRAITLRELKARPELADFALVKRGNRLSVLPVSEAQWQYILSLE